MKKFAKLGLIIIVIIATISVSKNIYATNETEKVKELFFDASVGQAVNLQLIEKFTNLEKLEICNYDLENISFLENLKNLTELKITNCGLTDIQHIEGLKKLTKLDLGYNQITDIKPLKKLTKLEKLKLNNNQIKDIKALEKLTKLTGLDLSSNQISDITTLRNLKQLALADKEYDIAVIPEELVKLINFEYLYLDDNQISNISSIDKEILNYTSAQKQKLNIRTNKQEIKLPNIFLEYKNLELTNCRLNDDSSKLTIEDINKEAIIKIVDSALNESSLTAQYDITAPTLMVAYGNNGVNNQTVTVTITSDEEIKPIEGWNLAENRLKLTKEYSKNTTEQLRVYDIAGNPVDVEIDVKNANKPVLNISYSTIKDLSVTKGEEIIAEADKYVGNPYVLGGTSLTEGIDCSHFVHQILQICGLYKENYIRSTWWNNEGEPVQDLEHAIAGDVIVWEGHVGFYDGKGKIVEAKGTKWGITHDRDAAQAIQKSTFLGIRRFTGNQKVETAINPNEPTNGHVKVTINSNKKIKPVSGWKLSKDEKTLTKTYTQNANETIIIKDFEGNEVETNIKI